MPDVRASLPDHGAICEGRNSADRSAPLVTTDRLRFAHVLDASEWSVSLGMRRERQNVKKPESQGVG
jgi:hypothetical protein